MLTLVAKTAKVTLVLDPAGLAGVEPPIGVPRVDLQIRAGSHRLHASVAAKSIRKALTALADAGPDGAVVLIQGVLGEGGLIEGAGLVVQPRVHKPAAAA